MGKRLMAVVAQASGRRIYLAPTEEQEMAASKAVPYWRPDLEMPKKHRKNIKNIYSIEYIVCGSA